MDNLDLSWELLNQIKVLLNQWDLEDGFNYESDKLDKKYETEIDNYFY